MSDYAYHTPTADPCECGLRAGEHRVKHREYRADGSRCPCGAIHRARSETGSRKRSPSQLKKRLRSERAFFMGCDGEGIKRRPHRYCLLAASDGTGKRQFWIENPNGLSTVECLEFFLGLPSYARCFGFSLGYDWTKILQDIDDETLHSLVRPETRRRIGHRAKFGPRPVRWGKYTLNLMGKRLTIRSGKRKRVVWDVFQFFQKRFVGALEDWKIGTPAQRTFLAKIKDIRPELDKLTPTQRRKYCLLECKLLAVQVHDLDVAHIQAGIPLRRYDGAGSSASSILRTMQISEQKVDPPDHLREAVASAFIGARFEHSVIGPVKGPIYSHDLSGAYSFHIATLPCLIHARWQHTRSRTRIEKARTALVRYVLHDAGQRLAWGPFPFREPNGTIVFPSRSGGGWVWRDEFIAGERLFPNVQFEEAWCLESDCDCVPFAGIPHFYTRRILLGADHRGLVLKNGLAACSGKLMQSKGYDPPFQNWVWAGLTTSGPRAQVLDAIGLHSDPWNLLAIAADGIFTREDLKLPEPPDIGTHVIDGKPNPKPLGGWVKKTIKKGVFFAKPGVYFPLDPTKDEIEQVRARGLGRKTVWEHCDKIVKAFKEGKRSVELPSVARFHGIKSSITKLGRNRYSRSPDYGEWTEKPVGVTLGAWPKRLRSVRVDGAEHSIMTLRAFPDFLTSAPYNPAVKGPEARMLQQARIELEEQPNGDDYSDYSEGLGDS